MRATLAALALAASPAAAQGVPPEPLRVGVIDTDAGSLSDPSKGVSVTTRSFLPEGREPGSHRTASGREHGADVALTFVEQSKTIDRTRPVAIYSAIAFWRSGDERIGDMRNRPMKLDVGAASRALDWFKENGVRVVMTAFVVQDSPQVQAFMRKARENGLVVFSATNNVASTSPPFPARHPDAIAVSGSDRNLDFRTSGTMRDWVAFQADGRISGSNSTMTENGSSFAVGRVAAFGAHLLHSRPELDRTGVVEALRSYSTSFTNDVPYMSAKASISRIRVALAGAGSRSKGPESGNAEAHPMLSASLSR